MTCYIGNPYFALAESGIRVAFSHQLNLCGMAAVPVTRLDGYTEDDIYRIIDQSVGISSTMPIMQYTNISPTAPILLDAMASAGLSSSYAWLNQNLINANSVLVKAGIPTIFDNTSAFIGKQTGLMGYFSWGSNDPSFTQAAYDSNCFAAGSIAGAFVSTSARTFSPTTAGQSLVADLISQGACGVEGDVSEPYVGYTAHPEILFGWYTSGFNLAESFYAASPELFWKSTVVGDPLTAPYANPPAVAINAPPVPLTGLAQISAVASSGSGISEVDFLLDGAPIGSCTQQPYSVPINTAVYGVGMHAIEVIATDASPAAVENSVSAWVTFVNPISNLQSISDAFFTGDGQSVTTDSVVVTAGTAEMGGSEFYVEEQNRSSGIRVVSTQPVNEGDVVTVSGNLFTDPVSSERSITASTVTVTGHLAAPPGPLGMPNAFVGGSDIDPQTRGVTGGIGPRNIGLLIATWGKVTYAGVSGENFFYVDDGKGLCDGSGHVGVKIGCGELQKPSQNEIVKVTGLSSCEQSGTAITRLVCPRTQNDIAVIVGP